jgi:hypothetical protein
MPWGPVIKSARDWRVTPNLRDYEEARTQAVVAHHMTGKLALDFHSDHIFWCTADPG